MSFCRCPAESLHQVPAHPASPCPGRMIVVSSRLDPDPCHRPWRMAETWPPKRARSGAGGRWSAGGRMRLRVTGARPRCDRRRMPVAIGHSSCLRLDRSTAGSSARTFPPVCRTAMAGSAVPGCGRPTVRSRPPAPGCRRPARSAGDAPTSAAAATASGGLPPGRAPRPPDGPAVTGPTPRHRESRG